MARSTVLDEQSKATRRIITKARIMIQNELCYVIVEIEYSTSTNSTLLN